MDSTSNADDLSAKYNDFTKAQLFHEFDRIISIPNARTNIDALTDMSHLLGEFEKRGIPAPTGQRRSQSSSYATADNSDESGGGTGKMVLGIVIALGGLAASAGTNSIFYGAIIVGVVMFFGGLMDMAK